MSANPKRDDTQALIRTIGNRMRPNPDRPRMSAEVEKRLRHIEQNSADCYADLEVISYRLAQAKALIDATDESAPNAELEDVTSIVHNIEAIKSTLPVG